MTFIENVWKNYIIGRNIDNDASEIIEQLSVLYKRSNMETKRVYFIMPNLTGGGAERVASILVNQFAEAGVDTTLVLVKNDIIEYRIDSRVKIDKSIMHESGTRNSIQQILDIRSYMKKKTMWHVYIVSNVSKFLCCTRKYWTKS